MKPGNISKQRILGQAKKLQQEKLTYLYAAPLDGDLYDWHFTIQGPQNTQFHEGLYHGQILLPYEYPFKPPDIVFFNKNGRFETNTKICLTITQYHPEEWNSAWTIRTMLQAVISLFAENVQGVGSLTSTSDIRRYLAKNSHSFKCEKCGPIQGLLPPRPPLMKSSTINPMTSSMVSSMIASKPISIEPTNNQMLKTRFKKIVVQEQKKDINNPPSNMLKSITRTIMVSEEGGPKVKKQTPRLTFKRTNSFHDAIEEEASNDKVKGEPSAVHVKAASVSRQLLGLGRTVKTSNHHNIKYKATSVDQKELWLPLLGQIEHLSI